MKRTLIVVNKREKGNILCFPKTLFNKIDLNSQLIDMKTSVLFKVIITRRNPFPCNYFIFIYYNILLPVKREEITEISKFSGEDYLLK